MPLLPRHGEIFAPILLRSLLLVRTIKDIPSTGTNWNLGGQNQTRRVSSIRSCSQGLPSLFLCVFSGLTGQNAVPFSLPILS